MFLVWGVGVFLFVVGVGFIVFFSLGFISLGYGVVRGWVWGGEGVGRGEGFY